MDLRGWQSGKVSVYEQCIFWKRLDWQLQVHLSFPKSPIDEVNEPHMSKIIGRVTIIVLTSSLMPLTAISDPLNCDSQIRFLPQTHRNVIALAMGETNADELSRSQFQVASYIQKNSELPVFSEQVDTDLDQSSITGDLQIAGNQLKQLFPIGIPKTYEQLSSEQRKQLSSAGADGVLLLTGRISALHKVVPNRATQDSIFARIQQLMADLKPTDKVSSDSELFRLLNDIRERMALAEIQKFFVSNPNIKTVLLVYGRLHNFKRHGDIFPSECIETPSDF